MRVWVFVATVMAAVIGVGTVGVLATGANYAALPEAIERERGVVVLNGPWKFKVGDDPRWAEAKFDDSEWERVDLTAAAGARDGDVGISGYVSGWAARGHAGYSGYAWYRMRVPEECERIQCAAMVGPTAVDSAYQVWVDNLSIGGEGDFSGARPRVGAIRPRKFAIAPGSASGATIAVRAWMAPWDLADDSGGMRVAPAIGEADAIARLYRAQWMQTIRGYVVEAAEAAVFFILAAVVWALRGRGDELGRCGWICEAMILTGLYRANQAVLFWTGAETVQTFEAVSLVVLLPSALGAWVMGWRDWFGVLRGRWFGWSVGVLAMIYAAGQFLPATWFVGRLDRDVSVAAGWMVRGGRLGLLALTIAVVVMAALGRRELRWKWWGIVAMVVVMAGQFAGELSMVGVPGIWFPFGVGVSRAQFLYVLFFVVMFGWVMRQASGEWEELR